MTLLTITAGQYCLGKAPDVIETFLGSCVGVAIYDGVNRIGGLLHIVLPQGTKEKARENPASYAVSGVPFILDKMAEAGADLKKLVVTLGGGGHIRTAGGGQDLKIGQRNILALRDIFQARGIPIIHENVGGDYGRHMAFHLQDGRVEILSSRHESDRKNTESCRVTALAAGTIEDAVLNLRPISDVALQALDLARDPMSSFPQLERLILQDQVITANILKLANSAYYHLPVQVGTLSQALRLLGMSAIRKLVMQIVVYQMFSRKFYAYSMEAGELFRHSVACARIAELLIGQQTDQKKEQAYLAGLLHDLGKVVLERCAGALFPQVVNRVLFQGMEFDRAEREVLGTDHSAVGRLVVDKWRLPAELGEAIMFHHQPWLAGESRRALVSAVHVADIICNMLGVGISSASMASHADPVAFKELGLDEQAVDNLLTKVPLIIGDHV